MEAKKKIRYIVTQYGNDWDYNFCTGVFDDSISAYGQVFQDILDSMSDGNDKEVRIRCEYDHNSGSFFDVICIKPENENHSELEEGYRVYFLEENEEEEAEK